jgi:hypothetical protein
LALAIARRLARAADGTAVDWSELAVTDLDALVLRLRQALLGDRLQAELLCRAPGCGQRIDLSFGIDAYLAHHTPRAASGRVRGWSVRPSDQPGWFCLNAPALASAVPGTAEATSNAPRVLFRVPTVADQLSVEGLPDAADHLARRCIKPADVPSRLRRRVEAAMEAVAPSLSGDLKGACPACGTTVTAYFEARRFCLQELRNRAAFVYEDIDTLAQQYHWSEQEILALPPTRRARYAELARQHRGS